MSKVKPDEFARFSRLADEAHEVLPAAVQLIVKLRAVADAARAYRQLLGTTGPAGLALDAALRELDKP